MNRYRIGIPSNAPINAAALSSNGKVIVTGDDHEMVKITPHHVGAKGDWYISLKTRTDAL